MEDDAIYQLISSGKTEGIFQLESPGMKNFMKELKPTSIEDVIAEKLYEIMGKSGNIE